VNLTEWMHAQGIHVMTAYRWYREGTLPVPARKAGRLILVSPGTVAGRAGPGRPVRGRAAGREGPGQVACPAEEGADGGVIVAVGRGDHPH
jgi:hypothetical protein